MACDIVVTPGVSPMGAPVMTSVGMCRTCMAESSDLQYIFFGTYQIMEKTLPELIEYVAQIKVDESDGLPHYVCETCISLAKSALVFKEQCQRSESLFKSRLNCYQEKPSIPIKRELEHCVDVAYLFQNNVKVEHESQDIFRKGKTLYIDVEQNENSNIYGPYQCGICTERFPFGNQLEEHVRNYHPEYVAASNGEETFPAEKFTCEMCNKNFTEKRKLLSHIERCQVRNANKQLFANDLNENVSSNNSVDDCLDNDYKQEESETDNEIDFLKPKDIKSEPEGSIMDNGENANSVDTLTVEQFSLDGDNSRKSKKRKKSNGIGKKEKRKKRHSSKANEELVNNGAEIRDNLSYPLPYSCTKCERKFRKLESLNVHLKKHEEQSSRVYQCDQCKREFQRKGHLDNHILTHSTDKGFACNICPKSFARQDSLNLHISNHKGVKKHQCNFCEKGFNVLSTLKDHIRTHTGEKPFLCSMCGRGFSQSTNLKEHLRRHQGFKPFKCACCDQKFVSKGELDAHTRKHSGAHPFVCDICGGGFTTSSSLVKHKRIHTGERPYQCDYCPMRFTALGTLKNHRRRHTGEKPYKCVYCEKAFAQKNDLVSHTRTHTGERPYVCTMCGHAFRQSSALKTHFKIHSSIPEDQMKLEKKSEPIQIVTQLLVMDDSHSSANLLTPKSESSH